LGLSPNPASLFCRLSRLITHSHHERLTLYFYNKSGGETIFPKAKKPAHFDDPDESGKIEWSDCASKSGVPLQSKRGDAVLFWSLTDDGVLDPGSLHGACPVVAGEKWTAVKWMRVAKFDGNFPADVPLPMPKLSLSQRKSDTSHETTARPADSSEGTEVSCLDEWRECAEWAQKGYCTRNPEFMIGQKGARDSKGPACPVSCGVRCGE
jgi:prolyl 4-hydroxylase